MSLSVAAQNDNRSYIGLVAKVLAVCLAAVIPLSNSLTTIISLLVAVACILYIDRPRFIMIIKHPITIAILIFIALNLIDITFSIASTNEIQQALRKYTRLLYFPLLLPLFTIIQWRNAAILSFLCAVAISVLAALSFGMLVFKDSIFTSFFVSFAIFTLLHYSVDYKRYRIIAILAALFFTYYLFFINIGRVGQFLFIILFLLFSWQRMAHSIKIQTMVISPLILIIIASIVLPSSFMSRQDKALREIQQYMNIDASLVPHESSMGTRLILAYNTLEIIKIKPLLGFGTGSFREAYAKYAPEVPREGIIRSNPHNQYLLTWAELGLPGLVSLLYLFFALMHTFIKSRNTAGYLGVGLVIAMAIGCCINSWLLDFTSAFFFVFFAAVFAAGTLQIISDK
jgi:O-antigen ligase